MRDFPKESVRQAQEIAAKYKKRYKSKINLATQLYNNDFLELKYGFDEAIRSGNCGQYLHEIVSKSDCFSFGGAFYLVAREAGLKPKLYFATDLVDLKEGADPTLEAGAGHTFITVETNKGERVVIDPLQGAFGKVRFVKDRNEMEIYNKSRGKLLKRRFSALRELSQDEYISMVEENKSSEGGRNLLAATQRVKSAGNLNVFITYIPNKEELTSSYRVRMRIFDLEPYKRSSVTDLSTKVDDKGNFDFDKGTYSFYYVRAPGWNETNHRNPQVPIRYSAASASKLFEIFNKIVAAAGRKSPVIKMDGLKLGDMLMTRGFSDRFEIKSDSSASEIIESNAFNSNLEQILEEQREAVNRAVRESKEDEISYKVLLRDAHTVKAMDKMRSPENPYGLLYSKEQHEGVLREEFSRHSEAMRRHIEMLLKNMKKRIFFKGYRYKCDRIFDSASTHAENDVERLLAMESARNDSYPLTYALLADRFLFHKKFDLETMNVKSLSEGLSEEDLARAAQQRLFNRLIEAYRLKDALYLASYKPGLRKILDRTRKSA